LPPRSGDQIQLIKTSLEIRLGVPEPSRLSPIARIPSGAIGSEKTLAFREDMRTLLRELLPLRMQMNWRLWRVRQQASEIPPAGADVTQRRNRRKLKAITPIALLASGVVAPCRRGRKEARNQPRLDQFVASRAIETGEGMSHFTIGPPLEA
jgi:hypothetical protein